MQITSLKLTKFHHPITIPFGMCERIKSLVRVTFRATWWRFSERMNDREREIEREIEMKSHICKLILWIRICTFHSFSFAILCTVTYLAVNPRIVPADNSERTIYVMLCAEYVSGFVLREKRISVCYIDVANLEKWLGFIELYSLENVSHMKYFAMSTVRRDLILYGFKHNLNVMQNRHFVERDII